MQGRDYVYRNSNVEHQRENTSACETKVQHSRRTESRGAQNFEVLYKLAGYPSQIGPANSIQRNEPKTFRTSLYEPSSSVSLSLSLLPDCLVTLLLFSSQILTLPLVMRLSGSSTTPRLFLCLRKSTGPNALVNVSAMFSRVPTKRGVTSPAATASLVK